jgi:glutamate racemase
MNRPIGIFDSGVGGVSILQSIRHRLPGENILYLADNANLPYGGRSESSIYALAKAALDRLVAEQPKLIVIACNTVTTAVVSRLRREMPSIPLVGVVPMIKPAAERTITGRIGVLATVATLQSASYAELKWQHATGVTVVEVACPGWVEMVEAGLDDRAAIAERLDPLRRSSVDMVVLGCTHYPFLAEAIRSALGPHVALLHPGPAVARQVQRVLEAEKLTATGSDGQVAWRLTKASSATEARLKALAAAPFDTNLTSLEIESGTPRTD